MNVKNKSKKVIELLTECLHPLVLAKVYMNKDGEITKIVTRVEKK
jgi:hypothetical protein